MAMESLDLDVIKRFHQNVMQAKCHNANEEAIKQNILDRIEQSILIELGRINSITRDEGSSHRQMTESPDHGFN